MQKIQLTNTKIMENIKFPSLTSPFFVWVYNNIIMKNGTLAKIILPGHHTYLRYDFNRVLFHPTVDLKHIRNGLRNLH